MFGKRSKVGLEITHDRFRFVEIQSSSKGHSVLRAADVPRVSRGNGHDGKMASGEELRHLLTSSGVKANEAVVVFDHHPVSVTTFAIEKSAADTIDESIEWHAEQYSPIPVDKSVISCRVCEPEEAESKAAVLVATEKASISEVVDILSAARIKAKRMDIVPFAIERLYGMRKNSPDSEHFAVAALRENNLCTIIWNGKAPDYFRYFRLFPDSTAETIVKRIKHTIQSYCDWHPLNPIDKVCFYRLTGALPDVERQLQASISARVESLNPLEGINAEGTASISGLSSLSHLIGAAI